MMPVADRPPASADAGEVVPRPKPAAAPGEARVAGAQREEPAPPAPTSVVIESIEIVAEPESPPAPVRRRTGERAPSGFSDYGAVRSYRYGMGR